MALVGEQINDPRLQLSLEYLGRELAADTTTASLCYALLGLAAHHRTPDDAGNWLETAYRRTIRQDANTYRLSLLALASTDTYPFTS